jgi:PAS domain S-box-containing protein
MNRSNDPIIAATEARTDEVGVILQLADGTIAACNAAAEKVLGMTMEQIQGWTSTNFPWQTIHPDGTHFPGEQHPAMVALSTGEPCHNVPMGFYQPDGNLVWLNIAAEPLFHRGEAMPCAVSVSITQLPLKAEPPEAPRSPDEQHWNHLFQSLPIGVLLEAIYATAPVGLCFLDTDLRFVQLNDRLAEINGFSISEHLGRTVRELLPDLADIQEPIFEQVLHTGVPVLNVEVSGRTPSQPDVDRDWLVNYYPLIAADGQRLGINIVVQEITARKAAEEALRQSELHNRTILDSISDGFFALNAEWRFTYINQAAEQVMGRAADLIGRTIWEEFPGLSSSEFGQIYRQTMENRTAESAIAFYPDHDRYYEARSYPAASGITVYFKDITHVKLQEIEQQRIQTQLRDRQERLKAALFASETGTFRWNLQTNELEWDENLDRLFGLPPGETVRSLSAFIQQVHPDDRQEVIDSCTRCATEGSDFDLDFRVVYPDGSIHWLSDKGKVLFSPDGQPAYMAGACVNITDRKRLEADLQQKNAILNVINESTPTPIFVKDLKGRYIFANPAALTSLGQPIDRVIGYRDDQIHPDFGRALMEVDRRVITTGQTEILEEQLGDCTFLSVKVPYRNADGTIIGLIGVANNISERVQWERDRERMLQQEQAAREASDRANRIKDEFLAVLSHELRSPLNPILGWSKMLKTGRLNEVKTQEAISIIERNAQLQAQLIEDLLDISRILQGKFTLNREPVNLELVMTSAQETVQLAADAKAITIAIDMEPAIGQVLGDAGRLQQVVWNLLTNAVKFTPENGQVRMHLARRGSQAQIQVIDTGKGISPDFLPHVFERFRQADSSTTRKFGGLGLGLAIVRQLVELHGGTITAESPGEDQGATFTVLLPLLEPIEEQFTHLNHGAAPDCAGGCPLSGYQILVVDDESDSREIVAFVLEEGGAIVTQAASAAQALELLSGNRFDALVSDIGMPEMNGYSLMQQVRARTPEQGGQIPALALTAYAGEINAQKAMQAGFKRHLAKPIDPDGLISLVVALLTESTTDT